MPDSDNTDLLDVSALPGIQYWGARRIERAISPDAAGGALVGILVASPLSRIAAIMASFGRTVAGPIGAHVAWYLGWLCAAYLALLVIAHWKQLDSDSSSTDE